MSVYDDPFIQRILLVELYPWNVDTEAVETKYVGSDNYITEPTDTPANTIYLPVIDAGFTFQRDIFAGSTVRGRSIPDRGALTVINTLEPGATESRYDDWLDIAQYTWSGRRIVASVIEKGADYSTREAILDGVIDDIDYEENFITFRIKSKAYLLDKYMQDSLYGGSGGADGGAELEGKPKPICLGKCYNIQSVLLNSSQLIYQFHDGAIEAVDAVRDNGVALTLDTAVGTSGDVASYAALVSASVAASKYATCKAAGLIKLGSNPAGRITLDVRGSTLGGTYSARPGSVLKYMVEQYSELSSSDVDSAAMTALNTDAAYDVAFYRGAEPINLMDAMDIVANSVGAFYGFNRAGLFDAGIFDLPSGAADLELMEEDIEEGSISRQKLGKPSYRVVVNYRKNWAVQNEDELAGSVSVANRALYSKEWLAESYTVAAQQTKYKDAIELVFDTTLYDSSAASAEAMRLQDIFGESRDVFTMTVNLKPLQVELNQIVTITHPRFNLSGSRDFRIIGFIEDYLAEKVQITVVG